MSYLGAFLIVAGIISMTIGGIGAIRLPDFYTRSHAVGVMDTLGNFLVLGGFILYYGFELVTAKIFFLLLFFLLANPTITHVFIRGAMKAGLRPWTAERTDS